MRRKTNARLALVLCLALVSGVLNVPGVLQGSGAAGTVAYAGVKSLIKVTKAKGSVTYWITSIAVKGGSPKKISINRKTGKLVFKKGTKRGVYTINISVSAAGNKKYKAKTVKGKVVVKVS